MRKAACLLLALAGCRQEMTQQKRYDPYEPAPLWQDGTAARPLPEGVVAQGDLARLESAKQPEMSPALLARGREQYDVFCSPCHGLDGAGDGMIVQRGFPRPPSFYALRLRASPARHFYDVASNGHGVMYSYAVRVTPPDRWAIAAYIRALQLSRQAELTEAPEAAERLQ